MRSITRSAARRLLVGGALVATIVGGAIVPVGAQAQPDPPPPQPPAGISAAAAAQIEAIAVDKAGRTRTERKVSSDLLYAAAEEQDGVAVSGAPRLRSAAEVDADGRTEVDISGTVDAALRDRIEAIGGEVLAVVPGFDAVRALLPVDEITTVAALPTVRGIAGAGEYVLNRAIAPAAGGATPNSVGAGANEADVTMGAAEVRAGYGVDGTRVKACVLSDGVDSLASRQVSDDLPAVDVLPGQAGSGDEGTAMLELIHDIAPGAELGFATAIHSEAQFAQNVLDLRADGCDVLVDDIGFLTEAVFQDGIVAQAISTVRAAGATYFSSAGNGGNLADGTSGTWQGDFENVGPATGNLAGVGDLHGWGHGVGYNTMTTRAPAVALKWADPLGGSANDYDVYVLNADGTALFGASSDVQDGDDDPVELIRDVLPGERIVVARFAGASRFLSVHTFGGQLTFGTGGASFGHNASVDAISTAATPAAQAYAPGEPVGPFPAAHSPADVSETFTSDGPVRQFFAPDGTPLTPGDFSATGGVVHNGVDITATDGTTTTTPGYIPFFGTSAAAPNAAAIATLALSAVPDLTPDELEAAMQASAIDIEEPGVDPATGPGITMAPALMAEIGAEPRAVLVAEGRTLVEVAGDGDDAYEPGEVFDLTQTLRNRGAVPATAVSATLASTSPEVTVVSGSTTYETIAAGATADPTSAFRLRIGRDCRCGAQLPFTFTATFAGGPLPTLTEAFDLGVGQRAEPSTVPYDGPSQPIPDGAPAGVGTTVAVGDIGAVAAVTLTLGGSECSTTEGSTTVGIAHPFVGDLTLTLTSPSGTTVTLADQSGGGGNNLCQTVFSDAGETAFSRVVAAQAPFTGTYRPRDPLSAFAGEDAVGDWTLTAIDSATADTGTLHAFSLEVTPYSCDVHNTAPAAAADEYDTAYEAPLSVPVPGVLGNDDDVDAEDDVLTAALVEDVDHGVLSLSPDGSFGYTPEDGFSGDDTFTYAASDGALASATTTVTITVAPKPNGAPVALADGYETPFETAYSAVVPGVLGNDTDEDEDPLTASLGDDVDHGTLALQPDGSFTYTPDDGFSGDDTFTYTAGDGELSSAPVTVTVTVGADPNAAPAAVPDVYDVSFETAYAGEAPGVLGNDTDADEDPLTATLVDDVDHGTLDLEADGSFTYTPDQGFTGEDTFTYTASDGKLSSAAATVTLSVTRSTDAFVQALYRDFLGRPAEASGLAFWGDRLLDGLDSRATVALKIARSPEYAGIVVRRAYLAYLGRPGDAGGLAFWAERVRTGLSVSELPTHLMGSAEFLARAGGTPGGFVDAIFQSVLGRAPTTGERAVRVAELAGGASRATVARTLHATVSARRVRVAAQFDLLLDRAPTLTERDLWVGRLATQDDRDLAVSLAATDEYLARAEA